MNSQEKKMMFNPLTGVAAVMGMAALLSGGATGCASMNESNAMRGADPIPAYQESTPTVFTGERSVAGFDRTSWPKQTVHVSVNDLESGTTFGTWRNANEDPTRRAAGYYPTHESALDLADREVDVQAQYAELFVQPAQQFLNTLLIPVFLISKSKPGTVVYGPAKMYTRSAGTSSIGVHEITLPEDDAVRMMVENGE